jgi:transposase InsO family protein
LWNSFSSVIALENNKTVAQLNKVGALRGNNGGKYVSNKFMTFCQNSGIRREFTCAHTPAQNGIAERYWRTIFGMTQACKFTKVLVGTCCSCSSLYSK